MAALFSYKIEVWLVVCFALNSWRRDSVKLTKHLVVVTASHSCVSCAILTSNKVSSDKKMKNHWLESSFRCSNNCTVFADALAKGNRVTGTR